MAIIRTTTDGIVFDFDHSEVISLEAAQDYTSSVLNIVNGAVALFDPDPVTKTIIAVVVAGLAATIAIHRTEFKNADVGNGVEVTLPWWAVAFQLWGALLMKSRPPVRKTGIGGWDLMRTADQAFAFDYASSGKLDHLVFYRPGTGAIFILKNNGGQFTPVYAQGDPGRGIGGYDLIRPADQAFAFDYDSSGKLDHLVLYRPGTGAIFILKNLGGQFTSVYAQGDPGSGIGDYDLIRPADRVFAFDYASSGKLDHLVLYRPGTGAIFILKNNGGQFTPVYAQGDPGHGIGGYDLIRPADQAFAFDYDSSGKQDHLVLYRPGTGAIFILKNNGGQFTPVYAQGDPGSGIGGYDLIRPTDRMFAFDYDSSGKLDHLVLYRPGTGAIFILKNNGGQFAPVYAQGDPGSGISDYDLKDARDQAFAFDYDSKGRLDHLVLYRPGIGKISILNNSALNFAPVYEVS